ncbi:MAG: DUF2085 domain-containing protein [Polyangiaceae bacterium]|nr:DUF2085 domain-containing protein [Polyangiaceae bacterium]
MNPDEAVPSKDRPALAWVVRIGLVLVGLGPFVPPATSGIPGLGFVGEAFEAWFAFQCHRDPGRSLHLFGRALPVCVRCLGIYAGLGLGGLVAWPRLGTWALRIWVGSAALVMILDVLSEGTGLHSEWPLLRLVTGILLAYPVGVALVQAARHG